MFIHHTHTHTHASKDSNSKDIYIITNFMHMNQMEKRKIFNLCTWTHVLTKGHWKWHLSVTVISPLKTLRSFSCCPCAPSSLTLRTTIYSLYSTLSSPNVFLFHFSFPSLLVSLFYLFLCLWTSVLVFVNNARCNSGWWAD